VEGVDSYQELRQSQRPISLEFDVECVFLVDFRESFLKLENTHLICRVCHTRPIYIKRDLKNAKETYKRDAFVLTLQHLTRCIGSASTSDSRPVLHMRQSSPTCECVMSDIRMTNPITYTFRNQKCGLLSTLTVRSFAYVYSQFIFTCM